MRAQGVEDASNRVRPRDRALRIAPLGIEAQQAGKHPPHLRSPQEGSIPGGPLGEAVRYGKKVLQTQVYASAYVGNGLNCSSCHLDAATQAYAAPCGALEYLPEYRARNGQVDSLQELLTGLS